MQDSADQIVSHAGKQASKDRFNGLVVEKTDKAEI